MRKVHNLLSKTTGLAQHKMMIHADKTRPQATYRVGELVWLYVPVKSTKYKDNKNTIVKIARKLKFPWQGPFQVVKQINANVVKLKQLNGNRLGQNVHVNRLKPYKERCPEMDPDLSEDDNFDPIEESTLDKTTLKKDE